MRGWVKPSFQACSICRDAMVLSVKSVADHRMTKMVEMDPDLVRATAVQCALDQADAAAGLQDAVIGPGGAAAARVDTHFFSMHRMAADRCLDCSAISLQCPGNEREIDFRGFPLGELLRQGLMSDVILGHDEAAARFLVETMHDPGPLFPADSGKAGAMMEERVDERVRLVAGAGMHHQTRRLVEHEQIFVLKKNLQRNLFGLRLDLFQWRDG